MNTITRSLITATMIGGAALGFAGLASAQSIGGQAPTGPGYSYSPDTYAKPAPTAKPGWHDNHGPAYIAHLNGH
jgi:hypothetical protein